MTQTVESSDLTAGDLAAIGRETSGRPTSIGTRLLVVLRFLGDLAVVVTAVAAVVVIIEDNELRDEGNALQRASQNSHLEEQMIRLDAHFVRYPQLRRFFYEASDGRTAYPGQPGRVRAQALATAEMVIDFADDIGAYVRVSKMEHQDGARWVAMMRSYFDESPIVREQWKGFGSASEGSLSPYDRVTACVLGAPSGKLLRHWNWRSGTPQASRSTPCDAPSLR